MSLQESVDATVRELPTLGADAAAVHLAQLYARLIDDAAGVAAFAAHVMGQVDQDEDPDLYDQVRALRGKLTERDTLDRIGARLHALLVELGGTPRARIALPIAPAKTGPTKLDALRGSA